jgi:HK97 family phage prohead protease
MEINFSTPLTATDAPRRIIAGLIAPYGELGHTSAGQTIFAAGSLRVEDMNKVHMKLEHDTKVPIGKMISFTPSATNVMASFKISNTTKGSDSLIEASEGLRSGLSVGAEIVKSSYDKQGVLVITDAIIREVSLVSAAAFSTAQVHSVAASDESSEVVPPIPPTNESEAAAVSTTEIPPVTPPEVAEPVVDAARPTTTTPAMVAASQAAGRTNAVLTVRSPILTPGNYLEHSIKAFHGSQDSRDYVMAADDSFTTNPAFNPVSYIREVAKNTTGIRPVIDACGGPRPLPPSGMTVSIPKITVNTTSATVAEGASVTGSTQMTSGYVNATVVKKTGYGIYSLELLERSDPSFYDILLENMRDAYALASDAYVIAEIVSGGTASSVYGATLAGLTSFVSTDAVAAYAATKRMASSLCVGTSWWTFLIAAQDSTTRPLFTAAQPMNSFGDSAPTTLRGSVLGLDLYVDPNMVATSIDDSMFIIEKKSIEIFESPLLKLQHTALGTGEFEVSLNGFLAAQTIWAGGLRRFNLT